MTKVDVLFGGWLKAPNGAAYVVNSLLQKKDEFRKGGIELNSWTLDNIIQRSFDEYKQPRKHIFLRILTSLKNFIHSFLSAKAKSSKLITKILLKKNLKIAKVVGKSYAMTNRNNIVFVHDIFTCYYYLKFRSIDAKVFLVLHNNGDTFSMLHEYYPKLKASKMMVNLYEIETFVLTKVSKIGFVAKEPMDNFLRLHKEIPKSKVTFVYNGLEDINTNLNIKKLHAPIEICCVGSVTYRKGQDLLIDAISELPEDSRSKFHVTIVGDGALRQELENKSIQNNLPISFVGYSKNVDKYLNESDIFILPSRDEGFPISILEAMRLGLPVISTRVAGIPEMIIHESTGLLIEPTAADLKNILSNIQNFEWIEMGNNSRLLFSEKFNLKTTINEYCKVLFNISITDSLN